MSDLLEFIRLEEALIWLIVICLTCYAGGQMASAHPRASWGARRCAAAAFIAYTAAALYEWGAADASEALFIVLRAMIAAGLMQGVASLVLSVIDFLFGLMPEVKPQPHALPHTPEPLNPEEPVVTPPPVAPPTDEQKAAAALARYEAKLQLLDKAALNEFERTTAKEKAKQQYMRELDEVMS